MSLAPDVLPSVGQVRAADPAAVRAAASAARSTQRQVDQQLRVLSSGATAWAGPASAGASTRHTEICVVGDVLANALGHLATALERAADEVDAARHLLAHADVLCGQAGGHITDVGAVVGPLDPGAEPMIRATVVEARRRYAGSVLAVRQIEVPRWWSPGAASDGVLRPAAEEMGALGPSQPTEVRIPQGLGPQALATWFAALPVTVQAALIAGQPDAVAAAEGLPAWAHDTANRLRLAQATRAAVAALEAARSAALASPTPIDDLGLGALQTRVADLEAVTEVVQRQDGHERQLLTLDLTGRRVAVAVSTGDVDHAGQLAVFVPGFTVTPATHLRGYDARVTAASDLAGSIDRAWGAGAGVVGVTWLGYAAPQVDEVLSRSRSVAGRAPAAAGAARLRTFLDGLAVARETAQEATAPDVTIWAHSYGSLVAGAMLAGSRGEVTTVRAVVALGSPGMGVSDPRQLGLPLSDIFVAEAELDPVAEMGVFGSDPGHWEGVARLETEARHLPDGSSGVAGRGHESYLAPGSTSAWNLAAIAAGQPDLALARWRCDEPRVLRLRDPACRP